MILLLNHVLFRFFPVRNPYLCSKKIQQKNLSLLPSFCILHLHYIIMVKAIFFDIDGTLVSFNTHRVPESTINALNLLREKGIKVFIATGRQFEAINNLGDLKFDAYITMNGSYCFVDKQHIIYKKHIPEKDIHALINYAENINSFPCFFVTENDSFGNYTNENTDKIFDQLNFPIPKIKPITEALNSKIYQVISFHNKEEEKRLLTYLPDCDATSWSPLFSDITPKGSSKQVGIDKILEYFNIPIEETMAFGDGGNDISMLSHVKTGIAMGNAESAVKQSAAHVTSSVDEDGIWNALKYFKII